MLPGALETARAATFLRAPVSNDTERDHFQRRLSSSLLAVFALSFGFWLVLSGLFPLVSYFPFGSFFGSTVSLAHLATTFIALAGWLVVRARKWSVDFLDGADVVTTLFLCWGWDFVATSTYPLRRPELVGVLAVTYTLVTRTSLVPSTLLRTAAIGAASFLPLVPATYAMYSTAESAAIDDPLAPTLSVALWSVLGVACAATISHIHHGLHLEVKKAMRLGQYVLETKIGEGGMGVVYRARHAMLRRPTAIKLLTGTAGRAAERFEREVQLTAGLTHPNTIAVFDYGRTPDGIFYYAMEYLEGVTLDELVQTHGPQPPARVVHLLLQICGALEEAHDTGLVHRDIKPANVMLTVRGGLHDVVKVLDFGLVKQSEASTKLTTSSLNAVLGTPHFMAPEAILDPPSVDARTDLYALGVVAYLLLTGERPFEGANLVEICSAHLHQSPLHPSEKQPGVPSDLEAVVLSCLEKKPEHRPQSARELAMRLSACSSPPWSRDDARTWWENAERRGIRNESTRPKRPARRGAFDPFGAAVNVAIDDRDPPNKTPPRRDAIHRTDARS